MSPMHHKITFEGKVEVTSSLRKMVSKTLTAKIVPRGRLSGVAQVTTVVVAWLHLSAALRWLAKVAEPIGDFFEHRVFPGFGYVLGVFLDLLGWGADERAKRRRTIRF